MMKLSTYAAFVLASSLAMSSPGAQVMDTEDEWYSPGPLLAQAEEEDLQRRPLRRPKVRPVPPGADGERKKLNPQRRKAILDKIRAARAKRLTRALNLGPAQGKALDVLATFDKELFQLAREGRGLRRQARKAAQSGNQAKLKQVTEAVLKLRSKRVKFQERRFRAVSKHLTPEQAAKAVHVLPRMDRRIGKAVRKALKGRPGPQGRRRPQDIRREF
jgi:hypothetical protein